MKYTEYDECRLCPRNCRVNRNAGQRGSCGMDSRLVAARAALHFWEEPCLTGNAGSGAVFFSGCALHCAYCQNYSIAHADWGKEITAERLSAVFLELQSKGACNINLVTAGHFLPHVKQALRAARDNGLRLPVIYNSSGYESVESLFGLEGYIDIYLPDFKYFSAALAAKYSAAPDYFERASAAVAEMVRQTEAAGGICFDPAGSAQPQNAGGISRLLRGVIVRHLVLPGHTRDSREILSYLSSTYGDRILVSIMNQYTPMEQMKGDPLLYRKLTKREYARVVDYACDLGLQNGFIQEGETAEESFIPPFDEEGL